MTDKQNQRVTELLTCIEIAAAAGAGGLYFCGSDADVFDSVFAELEAGGSAIRGEAQFHDGKTWRQWNGYRGGALSVTLSTPHEQAKFGGES